MIPNAKAREVQSKGVTASAQFGISMKDATHIMTILRDTLYSDKVLAVLREYSANAWDANREVGKIETPIKVTVPTQLEPTLIIQDEGPGLSKEDVFNVYTQYGASTKRDSNLAVGMLGIGSKSGFAYSDSFTIISCHGGKRSTYAAVLDETNAGTIQLLHQEDCGDKTGVSIKIAIRPDDIQEFHKKARRLYAYFTPRPTINIDLPLLPKETARLKNGVIYEDRDGWVAVMGCIPYRVDLEQLRGMDPEESIAPYVYTLSGALYFEIGDVEINASREELKYSEKTRATLVKKLNDLVDEFVKHTMAAIEADSLHSWDKRLRAQIFNRLGLPIPKGWEKFTRSYLEVEIKSDSGFHLITPSANVSSRIPVTGSARIVLQDDKRKLKGFAHGLNRCDRIAVPIVKDMPVDSLRKAVERAIKEYDIEHIPIVKLSDIPWNGYTAGRRSKNNKHKVKSFVIKKNHHHCHPFSHGWEIEEREPQDTDVFVILHKFKGAHYDFYRDLSDDHRLAKMFGVELPAIYGYKTTESKPLKEENCKGTEYRKWRESFYLSLITPEIEKLLDAMQWAYVGKNSSYAYRPNLHRLGLHKLKKAIHMLGKDHPITQLYLKQAIAIKWLKKLSLRRYQAIESLLECLKRDKNNKADEALAQLLKKYPLFTANYPSDFAHLFDWPSDDSKPNPWLDYIKLVDLYHEETEQEDESTRVHDHE